jgi:hypothetical protein
VPTAGHSRHLSSVVMGCCNGVSGCSGTNLPAAFLGNMVQQFQQHTALNLAASALVAGSMLGAEDLTGTIRWGHASASQLNEGILFTHQSDHEQDNDSLTSMLMYSCAGLCQAKQHAG